MPDGRSGYDTPATSPISVADIESDEDRRKRLEEKKTEGLDESIDWYSLDGPIAYNILAEGGRIDLETIRRDVAARFERIKSRSSERLRNAHGDIFVTALHERFVELNDFIVSKFSAAALEALGAGATFEDAVLARQFLSNYTTKDAALRIIADHGDASDLKNCSKSRERQLAVSKVLQFAAYAVSPGVP